MKFYKYRFGFIALVIVMVIPSFTAYARSSFKQEYPSTRSIQFDERAWQEILSNFAAENNLAKQKNVPISIKGSEVLLSQNHSRLFTALQWAAVCQPNTTVGVSLGPLGLGYIKWRDNLYVSVSLGPSTPKASAYYVRGKCEPLTGFFISGAAGIGNGGSITWYPGNKPSMDKIITSPYLGASAGVTIKVWKKSL